MKELDPVLKLLAAMVLIFVAILLWCAHFLKDDGQTFTVIASLVSGFAGALLGRIKPRAPSDDPTANTTSALFTATIPKVDIPVQP